MSCGFKCCRLRGEKRQLCFGQEPQPPLKKKKIDEELEVPAQTNAILIDLSNIQDEDNMLQHSPTKGLVEKIRKLPSIEDFKELLQQFPSKEEFHEFKQDFYNLKNLLLQQLPSREDINKMRTMKHQLAVPQQQKIKPADTKLAEQEEDHGLNFTLDLGLDKFELEPRPEKPKEDFDPNHLLDRNVYCFAYSEFVKAFRLFEPRLLRKAINESECIKQPLKLKINCPSDSFVGSVVLIAQVETHKYYQKIRINAKNIIGALKNNAHYSKSNTQVKFTLAQVLNTARETNKNRYYMTVEDANELLDILTGIGSFNKKMCAPLVKYISTLMKNSKEKGSDAFTRLSQMRDKLETFINTKRHSLDNPSDSDERDSE